MTEMQLEKFCERNPDCGCNCMKCPAFASYQRHELGYDDSDYEKYSLEQEIAETMCDDIGF